MTIEEKIFSCRRFLPERMIRYGFRETKGGYLYETELQNGDFSVSLFVSSSGEAKGSVIDNMNGEEYVQLRIESYTGAYVSAVRASYEALLSDIASFCCVDVLFSSEQSNRIAARIEERFGVRPDFPFDEEPHAKSGVFRHPDSRKWFGLIMRISRKKLQPGMGERKTDVINLKADEASVPALVQREGIFRAYHMSHKSWISVILDGTLTDDEVMELVENSFALTNKKQKK